MSVVELPPAAVSSSLVGVVGAGDPGSSRLVYAMVVGLVLVGIGLVVLAIWILRQTRPDLEVLAPLERMGDGDWKKRDPSTQRRMLDDVRPAGAEPLAAEPPPPPIDADFEHADHPVTSFSDLGPGLGGAVAEPVAESVDDAVVAPAEQSAGDAGDGADVDDATVVEDDEVVEDDVDDAIDDSVDLVVEVDEVDEVVDDDVDDAIDDPVDLVVEVDEVDEVVEDDVDDAIDDPVDLLVEVDEVDDDDVVDAIDDPVDEALGVDGASDDALSDPRG